MRNIIRMLGIALSVAAAGEVPAADESKAQDCKPRLYVSVPLRVTPEAVHVPVTLDGRQGFMALSTESTVSAMSKDVVKELKLKKKRLQAGPFGGPAAETAEIKAFQLGTGNFGATRFIVAEVPVAGDVIGTLGMDLFNSVDLELDLARSRMNLFVQNTCGAKGVYWTSSVASSPIVRSPFGATTFVTEVEGRKVETGIASSLLNSIIRTDASKELFGFDESSEGLTAEPSAEGDTPVRYRSMQLAAPGAASTPIRVNVLPVKGPCKVQTGPSGAAGYGMTCPGVMPLMLGRQALQQLRLYFASAQNVLYYSAASATP